LRKHEPGLWQRALGGVDEQEDAVHHRERTLHLAAEVGVTRGVDDVELDLAGLAPAMLGRERPTHRGVLRKDRDAPLALLVHRVHHPGGVPVGCIGWIGLVVCGHGAGLAEKGVHHGGLAVVDVGDDGHVAEALDGHGTLVGFSACGDGRGG
jgi:hypothetical protein